MHEIQSPDNGIERLIKTVKADVAPRVTPPALQAEIVSVEYFTAAEGVLGAQMERPDEKVMASLGLITFCVIVMRNGFTVHGMSACASPENFNKQVGRAVARANAENAMWPLLGYALKEKLWQDKVNNTLVENLKGAKPCES